MIRIMYFTFTILLILLNISCNPNVVNEDFLFDCGNEDCTVSIYSAKAKVDIPNLHHKMLGLKKGTTVEVLGISEELGYYFVKYEEKTGYVPQMLIKRIEKMNVPLVKVNQTLPSDFPAIKALTQKVRKVENQTSVSSDDTERPEIASSHLENSTGETKDNSMKIDGHQTSPDATEQTKSETQVIEKDNLHEETIRNSEQQTVSFESKDDAVPANQNEGSKNESKRVNNLNANAVHKLTDPSLNTTPSELIENTTDSGHSPNIKEGASELPDVSKKSVGSKSDEGSASKIKINDTNALDGSSESEDEVDIKVESEDDTSESEVVEVDEKIHPHTSEHGSSDAVSQEPESSLNGTSLDLAENTTGIVNPDHNKETSSTSEQSEASKELIPVEKTKNNTSESIGDPKSIDGAEKVEDTSVKKESNPESGTGEEIRNGTAAPMDSSKSRDDAGNAEKDINVDTESKSESTIGEQTSNDTSGSIGDPKSVDGAEKVEEDASVKKESNPESGTGEEIRNGTAAPIDSSKSRDDAGNAEKDINVNTESKSESAIGEQTRNGPAVLGGFSKSKDDVGKVKKDASVKNKSKPESTPIEEPRNDPLPVALSESKDNVGNVEKGENITNESEQTKVNEPALSQAENGSSTVKSPAPISSGALSDLTENTSIINSLGNKEEVNGTYEESNSNVSTSTLFTFNESLPLYEESGKKEANESESESLSDASSIHRASVLFSNESGLEVTASDHALGDADLTPTSSEFKPQEKLIEDTKNKPGDIRGYSPYNMLMTPAPPVKDADNVDDSVIPEDNRGEPKQTTDTIQDHVEPEKSSEFSDTFVNLLQYFPDLGSINFGEFFSNSFEKAKSIVDYGVLESATEESKEIYNNEDEFCGTDRLNNFVEYSKRPQRTIDVPLLGEIKISDRALITVFGAAVSAFTFFILLVMFFIHNSKKKKKDAFLIGKINRTENKLLVAAREIVALQDQLMETKQKTFEAQGRIVERKMSEAAEQQLNEYKKRNIDLEDTVSYLKKELDSVSTSALEMHKLLENSLATQSTSRAAVDEAETLRSLIESQEIQIEELRREISSIITENECLRADNDSIKSSVKKLEKECSTQTKKNLDLTEKNRDLTLQLDKEIENNATAENNYKKEIYQLRSKLEDIEINFKRSEFQVQELNRAFLDRQEGRAPEEVQALCDDVQLKIQVSTLEAMNVELTGQLKEEKNARRMLEEHVGDTIKELNNLKKSFDVSEKGRNEAATKLQVLTEYFKDKESQLHKELEAKEKQFSEHESKDQMLSQKLALMRDEINNFKLQNEELRKEILDQEASFKTQLANAEQKTREHWFALRQTERKYKETQQEAASLRNKVLILETSLSNVSQRADDKTNNSLSGDISSHPSIIYPPPISPDLLPYPSPSEFIPPPPSPIASHSPDFFPPEPSYSPDERLPPLGGRRAPTPPPPLTPEEEDEYSPPPSMMKYGSSGRGRNSMEPPVPNAYNRRTPPPSSRHRSSYKARQARNSLDSPGSSCVSVESLDKSGR